MLQDVSGRGTSSKKCFKKSLAKTLGARNPSRCLWRKLEATNASRCLGQKHLEQEMLEDVSGRGTWSKKSFKMSLAEALGARNPSRCPLRARNASRCLWQRGLEQETRQDVSGRGIWSKKCDVFGRGTWSKKCFKMSLAEGLEARNPSRCLWQRRLEQETRQDVYGTNLKQSASRCLWQRHLEQEMLQDVSGRGTWSKKALGARNASRCV